MTTTAKTAKTAASIHMIVDKAARERLVEITQKYRVSQPEAIRVLLMNSDYDQYASQFQAAREVKMQARSKRRHALNALLKLSTEELANLTAGD